MGFFDSKFIQPQKFLDKLSRVVRRECQHDKCCLDKCHFNSCKLYIAKDDPIEVKQTNKIRLQKKLGKISKSSQFQFGGLKFSKISEL